MSKTFKRVFGMITLVGGITFGHNANAGIPVIDETNLAQQIQQVAAWGQQFQQMQQQLAQMLQTYNSLNGVRGMASLVNNPTLRKYLPSDYQSILNNGYGNWAAIRSASKLLGIENTSLNPNSDSARAFESNANQIAINRAVAEAGYAQASQRFDTIQVLLDKINETHDAKDVAELQARIQAEQVMMQNEQTKLMMLSQLAQTQNELSHQRAKEISLKALHGEAPRF